MLNLHWGIASFLMGILFTAGHRMVIVDPSDKLPHIVRRVVESLSLEEKLMVMSA
jgi:hypothetical protein